MASYEDFEPDSDEDLYLKDVVAMPVGYKPGSSTNCISITQIQTAISSSVVLPSDESNLPKIFNKQLGTISISSDPSLKDDERERLSLNIKTMWLAYGKQDGIVQKLIQGLFNSSKDAFLSAVFLCWMVQEFDKNRSHSLAVYVVDQLELWCEEIKKLTGSYPKAVKQTALEAVTLMSNHKNGKLILKVIHLYEALKSNHDFVCVIKLLVEQKLYTAACRLATALQLFHCFPMEDFILPLIIQDKLNLAEEYLEHNPDMQKNVVAFLDVHIDYPRDMLPLISPKSPIPEIKYEKLNTKIVTKLVTRFAKRFRLDKQCYPKTNLKQNSASLRYLIHKKYDDNSIEDQNWEELVAIAVAESVELQVQLVNMLCQYMDNSAAVKWAVRFAVPEERLPFHLVHLVRASANEMKPSRRKPDSVVDHPEWKSSTRFHSLKLPNDRIRWVSSRKDVQDSLDTISMARLCGIDVEWQPTFGSQMAKAAVLQIATIDQIFLFDILSLREIEKINYSEGQEIVRRLFSNQNVLKVGFSLKEDLRVLSRSLPGFENLVTTIQKWADLCHIWSTSQDSPLFPSSQNSKEDTAKGLSGLVQLTLGLPLDKREQFSDWERRPLRNSQLNYAALDSYCLLEVFETLQKRSDVIGLDWSSLIAKSTPCLKPKVPRGRHRGRSIDFVNNPSQSSQ